MNLFRNPVVKLQITFLSLPPFFSMYKPLFTGKQAQKLKKLKHY